MFGEKWSMYSECLRFYPTALTIDIALTGLKEVSPFLFAKVSFY